MKTSVAGLEHIAFVEGEELTAYKDTGGVWTIGVGHTSDEHLEVTPGLTITQEKSRELLAIDVAEAEECINAVVKVPLTQNQYDALVSFAFNVGNDAFRNSTLLKRVNQKDFNGAALQFDRWVYDNGKLVKGLVNRRRMEKELFLSA